MKSCSNCDKSKKMSTDHVRSYETKNSCLSSRSEAGREVENLTERKNPNPRLWCQRICLSVFL